MQKDELFSKMMVAFGETAVKYQDGEPVAYYGENIKKTDLNLYVLGKKIKEIRKVSYSVTDTNVYAGMIRLPGENNYLLVGPGTGVEMTLEKAAQIVEDLGLPHSKDKEIQKFFLDKKPKKLHCFMELLELLYYSIYNNDAKAEYIEWERDPLTFQKEKNVGKREKKASVEPMGDFFHEDALLINVQYGRVDEVKKWFDDMGKVEGGYVPIIAGDQLHSFRLIFIGSLFLARHAVMQNKCDGEKTTALMTFYLDKFYAIHTIPEFVNLWKTMYLDFTQLVAESYQLHTDSYIVNKISKIILANMYEKITTDMIAKEMELSSSYLCRQFKQETGKTISAYTNEVKIREAERLLLVSNLSIIDIAVQLGYSSQAYFQTIFKKITGKTPYEYRTGMDVLK